MAIRRELLLIAVLLLVVIILVKAIEFFQVDVVQADAAKFVMEDLRSNYPGSSIEIMTIIPMSNERGGRYFEVKAKVTEFSDSPCPRRSHIFYNYPVQNFIPQLPEVITDNCRVCIEGIGTCTIAFPEEAVIASHTLPGTSAVNAYVQGTPSATPIVSEGIESWVVKWDSPDAPHSYVVEIKRDGTLVRADRIEKGVPSPNAQSGNSTKMD